MTGEEIRKAINKNNEEIHKYSVTFVFEPRVRELLNENKKLRFACEHNFDKEGTCIYCDMDKEFWEVIQ